MKWTSRFVMCAALFCLMIAQVSAQHAPSRDTTNAMRYFDKIKLTTGLKWLDYMVGDVNRGTYNAEKLNLEIGSEDFNLYTFDLKMNGYHGVDLAGLGANANEQASGFTIPANSALSFRGVYNNWIEYGSNVATHAGGVYADFQRDSTWQAELGVEQFFAKAPEVYFGNLIRRTGDNFPLFEHVTAGYSARFNQDDGSDHHFEHRYQFGGIIPVVDSVAYIAGSISGRLNPVSWNSHDRGYYVAFALPVSFQDTSGWAPSAFVSFRSKPGSKSAMAFGGFGGKAINLPVVNALLQSGFETQLIPTRVVNNRSFNIAVLSAHTSEFGRLAWEAVWYKFDISEHVSAVESEYGLYYTVPNWSPAGLKRCFVGVVGSHEDQILFDTKTYQLKSTGHTQYIVELGGRARIGVPRDRRNEKGFLRVGISTLLGSSGYEGTMLEATAWF